VPLAIGWINATRAFALMMGPLFISNLVHKNTLHYFFFLQGLGIILWSYLQFNFYISLIALFATGFFTTTLWSYTYTLLQKNIEEKYYGRIVAYNDMLFLLSAAFTSFMIGFLASNEYSLESITFLIGLGFILGAIYFKWVIKSQKIGEIE